MNPIKRIDPRRPFVIASSGLRRITLGQEHVAGAATDDIPRLGAHGEREKPRRTVEQAGRVLLVAAHSDRGALDAPARQAVAAQARPRVRHDGLARLQQQARQVAMLESGGSHGLGNYLRY